MVVWWFVVSRALVGPCTFVVWVPWFTCLSAVVIFLGLSCGVVCSWFAVLLRIAAYSFLSVYLLSLWFFGLFVAVLFLFFASVELSLRVCSVWLWTYVWFELVGYGAPLARLFIGCFFVGAGECMLRRGLLLGVGFVCCGGSLYCSLSVW